MEEFKKSCRGLNTCVTILQLYRFLVADWTLKQREGWSVLSVDMGPLLTNSILSLLERGGGKG